MIPVGMIYADDDGLFVDVPKADGSGSDRVAILHVEWSADAAEATLRAEAPDLIATVAARLVAADNADPQPWVQPTGAHDAHLPGAIVTDGAGDRYRNTLPVPNVWGLDVYGWENLDAETPTDPQPWVQPTGAHDAYGIGDQVTHNGQTWTSTAAGNVWAPGVFGWVVV